MRRVNVFPLLLALLSLAMGCQSPPPKAPREISLSHPGSTLSVSVDVEGRVRIVARILPGSPGAGEYASANPYLQEDATNAKNALNEPGGVTILVDESGELVGFGRTSTR